MKEKILRGIRNELQFKVWGFSTTRLAFVADILNMAFCFGLLAIEIRRLLPYSITEECRPMAAMLFLNALFFCFLPPYSWLKLHACWPLTAATSIPMLLLT